MVPASQIKDTLLVIVKDIVGQDVHENAPLMQAGMDSLSASELVQRLTSEFDVELPATLLFDHPSMSSIAA